MLCSERQVPGTMWKAIPSFTLGILCAFFASSLVSVYLLHDVDREMAGHLNEAFAGLCIEGVAFAIIVGGGAALLTLIGRWIFHLNGVPSRPGFAFFTGISVTLLQYPFEFMGRAFFPRLEDAFLSAYLFIAMILSAAAILADSARQPKSAVGSWA